MTDGRVDGVDNARTLEGNRSDFLRSAYGSPAPCRCSHRLSWVVSDAEEEDASQIQRELLTFHKGARGLTWDGVLVFQVKQECCPRNADCLVHHAGSPRACPSGNFEWMRYVQAWIKTTCRTKRRKAPTRLDAKALSASSRLAIMIIARPHYHLVSNKFVFRSNKWEMQTMLELSI